MKVYAISDTHFGHEKLVELSGRPDKFGQLILENIRNTHGDLLIHCGDFCIGDDARWHNEFMMYASNFSKKILVRGNHDGKSDNWYYSHGWDFVCSSFVNTYYGKRLIFTHIPMPKTTEFAANVHGHMHGNDHRESEFSIDPTWHLDMAPEIRGYKPLNLESV